MHDHPIDTLATGPGWRSRRVALGALVGVAIASALGRTSPVRAGKAGRKARKRCKRQSGQCETSVSKLCASGVFEQGECETTLLPCCPSFKGCRIESAILCLGEGIGSLAPPL
jgi:hypothetical protein